MNSKDKSVENWTKANRMQLNTMKSHVLISGKCRFLPVYLIYFLTVTVSQKDLGLIMQPTLAWNDKCLSQAWLSIGALLQLNRNLRQSCS